MLLSLSPNSGMYRPGILRPPFTAVTFFLPMGRHFLILSSSISSGLDTAKVTLTVWFVELAPLSDPALILEFFRRTLGLSEQAGVSFISTLSAYLRSRRLLLVLDNCEHLVDDCARLVASLLHNSTGLKIMASSREAFGMSGETIFRVPSLTLPDPNKLPEVAELSGYEAVALFIERAVAVQPHFQITNQNAPAVTKLCLQLDGIPLAIELAAVRMRMLTVEQIADRLDDRFRLGREPDGSTSQQTLRALVDWSYDLLSLVEKRLLARLSIFAGAEDPFRRPGHLR